MWNIKDFYQPFWDTNQLTPGHTTSLLFSSSCSCLSLKGILPLSERSCLEDSKTIFVFPICVLGSVIFDGLKIKKKMKFPSLVRHLKSGWKQGMQKCLSRTVVSYLAIWNRIGYMQSIVLLVNFICHCYGQPILHAN